MAIWEAKVEHTKNKGAQPGRQRSTERGSAELVQEVNNANDALRHLTVPWESLFHAVESSGNQNITLLAIEPDIEKQQVRINGEAKNFSSLMTYITHLQGQAVLGSVYLQNSRCATRGSGSTGALLTYCGLAGKVMMLNSKALMGAFSRYLLNKNASFSVASFQEQLRRLSRRLLPMLGWPGIIAISMIVMCLPFYFSSVRPMQDRLQELQSIDDSSREQTVDGVNKYRGINTPSEELDEFYKHFPPEKSSPHWLGKLVEVAERNGLSLNHGQYVVTRDKVGQLRRFKITLPVQGKYTQIRKFLNSLSYEIPNMALENVQFQRKDVLDTDVQVKIKLLLYMVQDS